jgi:hypothetical protein
MSSRLCFEVSISQWGPKEFLGKDDEFRLRRSRQMSFCLKKRRFVEYGK